MITQEQLTKKIETLQEVCTDLYNEYGLTEEILDLQTVINRLRNKHNITDKTEQTNGQFVQ